MLKIIFELLAANCADNMICSWFWLLDASWMLVYLGLLLFHSHNIVIVLGVQELCVLFCKLTFLLELEDACSIRSFKVESRYVILANVHLLSQRRFHLLLLLRGVLRKVVAFMGVSLLAWRGSTR